MPAGTAPILLPHADIDWGAPLDPAAQPRSRVFGDVYFSVADGLNETRTVFLHGCGLPDAFRNHFTIAELGFGTGLNFLATWQMWNECRQPGEYIHYISTEAFPLSHADATRALLLWPELKPLARQLLAQWPIPVRGTQRLVFDGITLTLHLDDAQHTLPQLNTTVDAWFLDGFAPAKNPQMWEGLYPHIARCSHAGTRLATYSVAGNVRRGLIAAGFVVNKLPGFTGKRERLEAVFT